MPTIKQFTNTKKTITLIHGITTNYAQDLVKLFLDEDTKVIVVDEINTKTKAICTPFLNNENFLLVNIKSLSKHLDSFLRIDYIYVLLDHLIAGSDYPNLLKTKLNYIALTNKDFTEIVNNVDTFIKLGIEYASKLTITLPYYIDTLIAPNNKYNLELLEHIRDLFFNHYNRVPFNGRLVYVPEIIGEKYDYSLASIKNYLIRQIVKNKTIKIPGDGLLKLNLITHEDAVKSLLLASFSAKATGKEILLSPTTLTILNFLYSALELTKNERKLEFEDLPKEIQSNIELANKYLPKNFITSSDLGFKSKENINTAIAKALATTNHLLKGDWQASDEELPKTIQVQAQPKTRDLLPNFGEKYKEFQSPIEKYFWYTLWKLFNIFIKTPVDFIYNLLTGEDAQIIKALKKWLFILIIAYALSLFLTPYIVIFNKLQKLQPQSSEVFLQQLSSLEQNLYSIGYLSKTGLRQQLTYLQEIIKTYEELTNKQQTASQLYSQYMQFIESVFHNSTNFDKKTYLLKVQSSPYILENIVNQLQIYNKKVEELTPKFNTLFEQKLLNSKPILMQQTIDIISNLEKLQTVYPFLPDLFGKDTPITYAILITDKSKPSILGGYPIGIFEISIKQGEIKTHSFKTTSKSTRETLYKAQSTQTALKILKKLAPNAQLIAVLNSDYIINTANKLKDIYIPEQGHISPDHLQIIISNFANQVKLPYTSEEFFNIIFNKLAEQNANTLQTVINTLFQKNNNNWLILTSQDKLQELFKAQNLYAPSIQKTNNLAITIYDTTNIFDTSYLSIKPKTDIIIYPQAQKITINYTYSGNKIFEGQKHIILNGNVTSIKAKNSINVEVPHIYENIHYKPNSAFASFIQFHYKNIKTITIFNPLNLQELRVHLVNPTPTQIDELKNYGVLESTEDNTYIFKMHAQVINLPLASE